MTHTQWLSTECNVFVNWLAVSGCYSDLPEYSDGTVHISQYLGYDSFGGKWQLAVKSVAQQCTTDEGGEEVVDCFPLLLLEPPKFQVAALPHIPLLIEELKKRCTEASAAIDEADRFVQEVM